MQRAFRPCLIRAAVCGTLLCASPAFAHIDLLEPEARAHGTAASADPAIDVNTNQKSGPCGQQTNGRVDRVATYAPGETITITVREETPHDSYIRVSIDLDGDDSFPLRPIMATQAETQEAALAVEEALPGAEDTLLAVVRETNNTPNFDHEIEVTLPDETCTTCTLQVVQFMYGAGMPYYFQCADLVIAEGGDAGAEPGGSAGGSAITGGASGSANAGTAGASGAGGASSGGSASTGNTAGAAGSGNAGSGSSLGDGEDGEEADDEGGCTLPSKPGGSVATGFFALLALALGLVRRRRS